jgi:hypothetical protein
VWCWLTTFEFHLICVSSIINGCLSCDSGPTIEWVVRPLLVASRQSGATGCWCWAMRQSHSSVVWQSAGGRECEVMGGASVWRSVGRLWMMWLWCDLVSSGSEGIREVWVRRSKVSQKNSA